MSKPFPPCFRRVNVCSDIVSDGKVVSFEAWTDSAADDQEPRIWFAHKEALYLAACTPGLRYDPTLALETFFLNDVAVACEFVQSSLGVEFFVHDVGAGRKWKVVEMLPPPEWMPVHAICQTPLELAGSYMKLLQCFWDWDDYEQVKVGAIQIGGTWDDEMMAEAFFQAFQRRPTTPEDVAAGRCSSETLEHDCNIRKEALRLISQEHRQNFN